MRHTYLKYALGAVMQLAVLCSCSEVGELLSDVPQHEQGGPSDDGESGVVEVLLSLPPLSTATRTSIDNDGGDAKDSELTAKWADGDSFGLLIRSSSDGDVPYNIADTPAVTEPYRFNHYADSHDVNDCVFAGLVPNMVGGSTYNYYAVYPYSSIVSVDGNSVRCTVPTVQSGRYDDGSDLMLAWAKGYNKLSQTIYNNLDFNFKHLTHALKITVPADRDLFRHPVERITIDFDKPVAGDVVLNVTDGSLDKSTLKSNRVEIRFDADHPFVVDEPFWVYIAPCDLTGTTVRFNAYNDTEGWLSESVESIGRFKDMQSSRITPVQLTLNEDVGYPAIWFDYEILDESSRLGEELETLNLTLPQGLATGDGETGVAKLSKVGKRLYRIVFRADEFDSYIASNGTLDFQPKYESEHALLSPYSEDLGKFVVAAGQYKHDNFQTIDYVPYILEQDFDGLLQDIHFDDDYAASGDSDGNLTGHLLYDAYLTEPGWNVARCGGVVNTANGTGRVRINVRYQSGAWVVGRYCGRLDTPALSALKGSAKISLSYDIGCYIPSGFNVNDASSENAFYQIGTHTKSMYSKIDGENQNNINRQADIKYTSPGMNSQAVNYDSDLTPCNLEIENCGNTTRIVWFAETKQSSSKLAANQVYYFYIDNIKVSIAK